MQRAFMISKPVNAVVHILIVHIHSDWSGRKDQDCSFQTANLQLLSISIMNKAEQSGFSLVEIVCW
jgi:hypothetical protein